MYNAYMENWLQQFVCALFRPFLEAFKCEMSIIIMFCFDPRIYKSVWMMVIELLLVIYIPMIVLQSIRIVVIF